jgi:hypothetical protein
MVLELLYLLVSLFLQILFKAKIHIWMLQAAVISLGLIGAGTNNARIAGMLRSLSCYYYKDASLIFCV